jgi:predicted porin
MKKNVIALAVAAAMVAPLAAQADVKVSGQVKVTVTDNDSKEWGPTFDNNVGFSASEDIGGGMTAMGKMVIDMDADGSAGAGVKHKDAYVGVSADFGTVLAGRMETLTEGKVSSQMDDGASSHNAINHPTSTPTGQLESSLTAIGRKNALAYVSPSFNGVTVGAAVTLHDAAGATHHTDIAVMYSNGPLDIKASVVSFDADELGVATAPEDVMVVGASYKIDALKVGAQVAMQDSATAGVEDAMDIMVRVDYAMGNNKILLGYKTTEEGADNDEGDVIVAKLTHSFSKTAAIYVGTRQRDDDYWTTKGSDVFFGMIKKF